MGAILASSSMSNGLSTADFNGARAFLTELRIIGPDAINAEQDFTRGETAAVCALLMEERRFKPENYTAASRFYDVGRRQHGFSLCFILR